MQVAFITPFLLLSPIAGAMVDRYNRKMMMMISDLGAVLSTTVILILYTTGHLEFWHLYIAAIINGSREYIPVASLFCCHQYNGSKGTIWTRQRYDVPG